MHVYRLFLQCNVSRFTARNITKQNEVHRRFFLIHAYFGQIKHTNTPFVYVKFMPNLHHAYPVYRTIHSQTLYKLNYTIRITQYKLHNTNNTINIPLHTCDHLFTQTFTYECINYIAVILFEYLDND